MQTLGIATNIHDRLALCGDSREARLDANFSINFGCLQAAAAAVANGILSTATFAVADPSLKNTWTALAIERFPVSR